MNEQTLTAQELQLFNGVELREYAAKIHGGNPEDYRKDPTGRMYTQSALIDFIITGQAEKKTDRVNEAFKEPTPLTALASTSSVPNYMTPPKLDKTYKNPVPELWDAWEASSRDGNIENIALRGPSGTGKTSMAEQFAARYNRPYIPVECGMIIEPDQLWGNIELPGGGTMVFHPSPMLESFERIDRPVILLNEANRFQAAKTQNAVLSMLDHQRVVYIEQLKRNVPIAPGITFFVTLNEGFDYSGTDVLDAALKSRLYYNVTCDYLKLDDEVTVLVTRTGLTPKAARNLCQIAANLRQSAPISLRNLEATARLIKYGVQPRLAIFSAFSSLVELDQLNAAICTVVDDSKE